MLESLELDVDLPYVILDKASSNLLMAANATERYQIFFKTTGTPVTLHPMLKLLIELVDYHY